MNKVIFKSFRPWLNKENISVPAPTQKVIPNWYKDADRFAKNPYTGEYFPANQMVCPVPKKEQQMITERFLHGKHVLLLWMVFQRAMFC